MYVLCVHVCMCFVYVYVLYVCMCCMCICVLCVCMCVYVLNVYKFCVCLCFVYVNVFYVCVCVVCVCVCLCAQKISRVITGKVAGSRGKNRRRPEELLYWQRFPGKPYALLELSRTHSFSRRHSFLTV